MYMYPHPITSIDATTQFKDGNILLLDTLQKECVKNINKKMLTNVIKRTLQPKKSNGRCQKQIKHLQK